MQDVEKKAQIATAETAEEVKKPYAVLGTRWLWGFNPSAEIWNGRLAMIGFLIAALIEIVTGQGFLHFWGLVSRSNMLPPQ